jgi:hypothetical protein
VSATKKQLDKPHDSNKNQGLKLNLDHLFPFIAFSEETKVERSRHCLQKRKRTYSYAVMQQPAQNAKREALNLALYCTSRKFQAPQTCPDIRPLTVLECAASGAAP